MDVTTAMLKLSVAKEERQKLAAALAKVLECEYVAAPDVKRVHSVRDGVWNVAGPEAVKLAMKYRE